jgi:hypothetical protein
MEAALWTWFDALTSGNDNGDELWVKSGGDDDYCDECED